MSNGPHNIPGRRIKNARGFKVKVFDVLHNKTWWYSKTYTSLLNIKLAIAQRGFVEYDFLDWDHNLCVELFIYDVETWELAAFRKGDGGTNVVALSEYGEDENSIAARRYWIERAGEWEADAIPEGATR